MAEQLAIWGVGRNRQIMLIDFGAVPRRSSSDVPFRVRNDSAHYTAVGAVVSLTGAYAEQFYLSSDGLVFTASIDLGDMPATSVSPVLTLRRVTASTAAIGDRIGGLRVAAASWQLPDTPEPAAYPSLD